MDRLNDKWLSGKPNFYFRYKRMLLESMIEGTCLNVGCGSHIIDNAVNVDEGLPMLPYKDASFDTVICSDVLEHIKPHDDAISELFRVARKKVIITVPAYQWLYGNYDRLLRHRRRYGRKDFPGFKTKYLFWFLVPVLFMRKMFSLKHYELPSRLDNVLFWFSKFHLGFGTTILAVKYKETVR